MVEQLSHSADRQKGMSHNFALLVVSVVKCLPIICSTRDGTRPFPGSLRQLLEEKEKSGGESH